MSDDSETVEDTKKGSLAEVTDDPCTVEFIEIVPLDTASDDYHTPEFIYPVVAVSPEDLVYTDRVVEVKSKDLQDVKEEPVDENDNEDTNCALKQEPADEYEIESPSFTTQVRSVCKGRPMTCLHLPVYTKAKKISNFY